MATDQSELTLSTCSTRTLVDEDVVRAGNVPPPTAPRADHETDQSMVVDTVKAPSLGSPSEDGCPAEEMVYVCEQPVDCWDDEIAGSKGVPGPAAGRAPAITGRPDHGDRSRHRSRAHRSDRCGDDVGVPETRDRSTSRSEDSRLRHPGGLKWRSDEGRRSEFSACRASANGLTAGVAPAA